MMMKADLHRIRRIARALPEVTEQLSHDAPCFFVRRRPLCYYHDAEFSSDGRASLWCPVPSGVQEELVSSEPVRFFMPAASARGVFSDWLGVHLDISGRHEVDWDEIAAILVDTYRHIAPRLSSRSSTTGREGQAGRDSALGAGWTAPSLPPGREALGERHPRSTNRLSERRARTTSPPT
jgi:hypothetical protein